MAVDVTAVNARIAQGLMRRTVTIEDLPATVIEFREGAWQIASIVTERMTRQMEPNDLVVFDVGSNVKEILSQLIPPLETREHLVLQMSQRPRVEATRSLLLEAEEATSTREFAEAERLARAAVDELALLASGR